MLGSTTPTPTPLFIQMFGCGAVAQLVLSEGSHGMFLTVNFAFGFAATLGILVCGQVSGKIYMNAGWLY